MKKQEEEDDADLLELKEKLNTLSSLPAPHDKDELI